MALRWRGAIYPATPINANCFTVSNLYIFSFFNTTNQMDDLLVSVLQKGGNHPLNR